MGLGFWCSKIFLFLKRDVQVSHTTDHMYHIERNDDEIILISAYFAAGRVLGLQYEAIIKAGLHFPIPVICGEHRLGKTKSAKAALHLMGNHKQFFSSARERFIPRLCSRSTFPPVLDDMKNAQQLGELALAYFDGGKDGTCSREMIPKTCPLVTANWEALEGLPQDYRYIMPVKQPK